MDLGHLLTRSGLTYPEVSTHVGPDAKGSNPTTGLTLLWARNPFRGNFNHWQVSRKEAGQIFTDHLLHIRIIIKRRITACKRASCSSITKRLIAVNQAAIIVCFKVGLLPYHPPIGTAANP